MKYSMRCTLRFGCEQEGAVECTAEFESCGNVASKVRDSNDVGNDSAVLDKVPTSGQGDVYNSVHKTEVWGALEKDEGSDAGICNSNFWRRDLFGLVGFVGHDGISRYWSSAKECWLPVRESSLATE
jgi:hypothetical protein